MAKVICYENITKSQVKKVMNRKIRTTRKIIINS